MKNIILILVLALVLIISGRFMTNKDSEDSQNPKVSFKTNMGEITLEIYKDKMPITADNFLKLVGDGFYNGTKFHRVVSGFMIQGGDPNSKSDDVASYGTGGPGYTIKDEFSAGLSNVPGTIAMANAGPNTGGSQFFINVGANTFLDSKHPVFGRVVSGMEIVNAITAVEVTKNGGAENSLPVTPIIIEEGSVLVN